MSTLTAVGYVSDLCRKYLGNPSQVCIITFKDTKVCSYVASTCILHRITWEVLLMNPDTDACVPNTIIINPDDLERIIEASHLQNDDYHVEYH